MKTLQNLSLNSRTLLRVGLQVLVAILVILRADPFWTGIVLGILFAVLANEVLLYRQARSQNKTNTKRLY
ncbi:hypothetical protein [Pontibacter akesuensis]|uniref:Uncharacterized protein n=1 Tax=Pontibacter akesuensis TaxID=388950 RepID=A0A1I7JAU2_9BACT|nr:hypothetical protein [Pontibacter akesuensis]GHA71283.1 hypothetical protein GCM10007389_26000 [Pontibacter akesuensis]SFU82360.1 hypothetical protein SAMN04487941_2665 [Pontibacter akesuensis]